MPTPVKVCSGCGAANDPAFTLCCQCGVTLPSQTVEDVVAAWFDGEQTMFDALYDSPEVAWSAILQILGRELNDEQIASLAAGPVEELLVKHGAEFIDRVVSEAERNPRFNHLLGGVWQSEMSQELWLRVQSIRKKAW
jgi:hypothetical protein